MNRQLFSFLRTAAVLISLPGFLVAQQTGDELSGLRLGGGLKADLVYRGITGAACLQLLPDGNILIGEQPGGLLLWDATSGEAKEILRLEVDSHWERGLLGLALDPGFPGEGFLYVHYTHPTPYSHTRVSRFPFDGKTVVKEKEQILFEGEDQTKVGGQTSGGHQGGPLVFGPDGCLYIGIGDYTRELAAPRLDSLQGKILRINKDGSIPRDNPWVADLSGKHQAIWAKGLRNPWGLAFDPAQGHLYISDVGQDRWEEIHIAPKGGLDMGWPGSAGPFAMPNTNPPAFFYGVQDGKCIAGGTFVSPDAKKWPAEVRGGYLFADYLMGWVAVYTPGKTPPDSKPRGFATGFKMPVAIAYAPDESLYVLCRNQWVKDENFKEKSGYLVRLRWP
jgi:glucose/arabinose dehydrogenase